MTRWLVLALLVVLAAMAAVVGGAWRLVQRDRFELVERFSAERQRQVAEAAREIGDELDDIGRTLRVVGALLQRSKGSALPESELETLLAASGQYRVLAIYDGGARLVKRLGRIESNQAGGLDVDPALAAGKLDAAARDALSLEPIAAGGETVRPGEPGETIEIRGYPVSVPGGSGWSRIFAAAVDLPAASDGAPAGRKAIAVLLDMPRLFDKLHLLAGDGATRSFLIGGAGEPTAASDPDTARTIGEADDRPRTRPDLAALLARMRAGGQGSATVGESESRALGLGPALSVASFATIHGTGAGRGSMAPIASTAALRDHDRALVRRLTLAAGAVALLLAGFGAWLLLASRRALLLRERVRHADELAHLHEQTEKILDHVPTAVLVLSDDGRVTAANRAARDRLPAEAIGATLAAAFPEAPAAVVGRLSSLVASARAVDRVRSLHGEQLALFGEQGQYSVHAVPFEPRFPEARALLVIEDVSEVRSLASQLLRAEKLATIGVLSAGIAHEIGTPLGVVRGRAEYILGKLGPAHPQAPGLAVIVEQIDRVSRTIRQLLDFARVKPAVVRQVEVAPVARAVVELLRYEAERRKVELAVDCAGPLAEVMADPDQLQQVLLNLAINAVDACADGGHVTLRARNHVPHIGDAAAGAGPEARDEPGWRRVRIEVIDDGCGIPEELRHQVFDPFFTTKKRGQGTGLGLSMAAEIARNHGAEIEIESAPGRGTRMILLWPTHAAPQQGAAAAATDAPASSASSEARHGAA